MSGRQDRPDPVTVLQLWKDEMVRRLTKTALDAIEPAVRAHAIEVVSNLNMQCQEHYRISENQFLIALFGKVEGDPQLKGIKE